MPRPKIDLQQLKRLLAEGHTKSKVAQMLKVSPSAVTKAAKKLDIEPVFGGKLDAAIEPGDFLNVIAEQMQLYHQLKDLWHFYLAAAGGKKTALNKLNRIYKVLGLEKVTDPSRLAVHTAAEMRMQLKLHADLLAAFFTPKSYQEFMDELAALLFDLEPAQAHVFLRALKEKYPVQRSLRAPSKPAPPR